MFPYYVYWQMKTNKTNTVKCIWEIKRQKKNVDFFYTRIVYCHYSITKVMNEWGIKKYLFGKKVACLVVTVNSYAIWSLFIKLIFHLDDRGFPLSSDRLLGNSRTV